MSGKDNFCRPHTGEPSTLKKIISTQALSRNLQSIHRALMNLSRFVDEDGNLVRQIAVEPH